MLQVGVLASHQGTNFQSIADACADGELNANVSVLVCNNSSAPVIQRAERAGIPAKHLSLQTHADPDELDIAICDALTTASVELVVLAGYMKKLGPRVLARYEGHIINVHPALLPRHGGRGCYGMHVHEAVIRDGDKETGATVHLVNGEYDMGNILHQESTPVETDDTAESLAEKVHAIEYRLLLSTIDEFSRKS
ncbi:MAG: phosphoribosylglycinamide formyltransferase [Gammaproteobacteria bacterium]|jgi:phosphoribosylglycinamide formyltransferase 1|nr:phosphoribosylglycinamide formyltransferase [Gammaproteobacteria bacterium]MBT4491615.1 phosphoribosylglycinamide formyltransferase [Gammaproteobacteria bacterium]MBT7371909.1 phosphoribosylglycinamide formyltransferase [Gammaproteobacteria bacterium]